MSTDDLASAVRSLRGLVNAADQYRLLLSAASGLGASDIQAMGHLHRDSPMPQGDLARMVGVSPSGATALMERLLRAGVARRAADPGDRRHVLIELTDHGRSLVEQSTERIEQVFAGVDHDRLRSMISMLEELTTATLVQCDEVRRRIATAAASPSFEPALPTS